MKSQDETGTTLMKTNLKSVHRNNPIEGNKLDIISHIIEYL
jgi:hypothetical protein